MPQTIAQAPLSQEDIEKYEGKWVAVAGGEVLAAAESIDELVNDERVRSAETKALYHVSKQSTLFY